MRTSPYDRAVFFLYTIVTAFMDMPALAPVPPPPRRSELGPRERDGAGHDAAALEVDLRQRVA
jgi:hypothetical protein